MDRCEKAKAGLRHAVVYPNVTGRTKKRKAQSKWARADSLALVDEPQVARPCILRAFGLQIRCHDVFLWSGVVTFVLFCFVLFCFVFVFYTFFVNSRSCQLRIDYSI